MKAPERLLSTPRIMAVLLVITTCYLAITGVMKTTEFVPIVMLALTFFYKQRQDENKQENTKKETAPESVTQKTDLHDITSIQDVG